MSPQAIQAWLTVVGGVLGSVLAIVKYIDYLRTKRDKRAAVGTAFASTVDRSASDNATERMAGAVLLRRFFDQRTEQGEAGTPYIRETIDFIAGMLRVDQSPGVQKVLADALHYAVQLRGVDLSECNLKNAFIGVKQQEKDEAQEKRKKCPRPDLSGADLYGAKCTGASFREVIAVKTVFKEAILTKAVFEDADCREADFRGATLSESKFGGARIGKANFAGAQGIPAEIGNLLENDVALPDAVVTKAGSDER